MIQRRAERFGALPEVKAEFTPLTIPGDESPPASQRITALRVRDISNLDCALEVEGCSFPKGTRGKLFLSLGPREPTIIHDVKVERCWDGGIAVSFSEPQPTQRYFGEAKRDGFSHLRERERKLRLAAAEMESLEVGARLLESDILHVGLVCLLITAGLWGLSGFLKHSGADAAYVAAAATGPAWAASICMTLSLILLARLNRMKTYVAMVKDQVARGSFMPGYRGWEGMIEAVGRVAAGGGGQAARPSNRLATLTVAVSYPSVCLVSAGWGLYESLTERPSAAWMPLTAVLMLVAAVWLLREVSAGRYSAGRYAAAWEKTMSRA